MHTCTNAHIGNCIHEYLYTIHNLQPTKKKTTDNKQGFVAEEDSSEEWKTRQIYCFWKSRVLRLGLNTSREGFFQRGKERSFHVNLNGPQKRLWNQQQKFLYAIIFIATRNLEAESISYKQKTNIWVWVTLKLPSKTRVNLDLISNM